MMDIRRLDLTLLLLLDGLLTSGNLSATARRLEMSQPSASAALSRLRHFFNDELFIRTGRGLRPTPLAERLAKPVRAVIEKINEEILLQPVFEPRGSDRVFTLTMPDLGEMIFLPPIIEKVHAEAPGVSLKCVAVPHKELLDTLERGTVDLAIGYFPDLHEPATKSQLLFEDVFSCIVRIDHPTVGDSLSIEQFLELDHLVVEDESISQEKLSAEVGLKRRTLLHIPHFMSVPRLIAGSDMIGVVPLSLASWYAQVFGLRVLEPPMSLPKIPLKQFWHRRIHNDPAVRWLRGIVSDRLVGRDPRQAMSPIIAEGRYSRVG
jgi:DNA-binding transcriptional LysR family regulator